MTTLRPSLLEGDVAPHLRRLSIPLVWGLLSLSLFYVVDTFYISRLGTLPLAALGFTIPVVLLNMGIVFGLCVGTTSVLSRVFGQGDSEKFRQMATDALSLTVVLTLTAAVLGLFFMDPMFRMMGARDDLLPLIHRYVSVWYCGFIFFGTMMVGNATFRATGDTRLASRMMMMQAAINLALDPFLIFGWGPFPRLGMAGAAATLVFTYYTTCMVTIYTLVFRKKVLSLRIVHPGIFESWRRILHVAFPSIISNQISPISAAVITWMAAGFGKEAVAALGVATRIENLSTLVFYAIGAGLSIFTGQNFGAGNFGRIQEAAAVASRYCIYWGVLVAAGLWVFARDIPELFDNNPMVVDYAAHYLHWVPVSYGAMGMMIASNAALNAMGRPLPATFLILLRAVVFYVPLAWVLREYCGFTGIIVALTITNLAVGAISYVWNRKVAS